MREAFKGGWNLLALCVALAFAAGCSAIAKHMEPTAAQATVETGQKVAATVEDIATQAAEKAHEVAVRSLDPFVSIGASAFGALMLGLAALMRKGKRSAEAALDVVTRRIEQAKAEEVKRGVAETMTAQAPAVRAALEKSLLKL